MSGFLYWMCMMIINRRRHHADEVFSCHIFNIQCHGNTLSSSTTTYLLLNSYSFRAQESIPIDIIFLRKKMVPKSGSEFETSLRSTTNFLKKNKKSVGGMKKTSKKISVSESNEKIEIDNFQQGGQRKKEIQIFGINFVCKVLHFLNFRTRSKRRN